MPAGKSLTTKSVLFVCSANQCRSPMAEAFFKDMVSGIDPDTHWQIESAGCWARPGNPATYSAIEVLNLRGIDLSEHNSQPVTETLLENFNLILCMESEHKRYIQRNFSSAYEKTYLLTEMIGKSKEIWDPVGMTLEIYNHIADEIIEILDSGFEALSLLASVHQ